MDSRYARGHGWIFGRGLEACLLPGRPCDQRRQPGRHPARLSDVRLLLTSSVEGVVVVE